MKYKPSRTIPSMVAAAMLIMAMVVGSPLGQPQPSAQSAEQLKVTLVSPPIQVVTADNALAQPASMSIVTVKVAKASGQCATRTGNRKVGCQMFHLKWPTITDKGK